MAKEHVECNTGLELLHQKVDELYHIHHNDRKLKES